MKLLFNYSFSSCHRASYQNTIKCSHCLLLWSRCVEFLETKINNLSEELLVINTIKLENITHYHFDNVDLLITTHDIPKQTLNILPKHLSTIKVAPLFSEDDRHKIRHIVKQKQNPVQAHHHMDTVNFLVVNTEQNHDILCKFLKKLKNITSTSCDCRRIYRISFRA